MKRLVVALVLLLAACQTPDLFDARTQVRKLTASAGVGSGVVLAPGIVLTAQHVAVVPDLTLRANGAKGKVLGIGDSDKIDLALLYFPSREAHCPCVKLAEYEAMQDETIYVVGYPLGITRTMTQGTSQGVVKGVNLPGMFGMVTTLGPRLVFNAAIAPGNSGGAVFVLRDGEFQLVGIVVEGMGGFGFAIPLSSIKPFLAEHM